MRKESLNKAKVYETLLVMVVGFLVIFALTKWNWLLYLNAGIGIVSILSFSVAKLIVKFWLKLAEVLGLVNGKLILSLIFFLFLTPIALLYRFFVKKDKVNNTSWKKRKHQFSVAEFEKVW